MSAHRNSVGDDLQSSNTDRMLMRDLSAKGAMFQPGVSDNMFGGPQEDKTLEQSEAVSPSRLTGGLSGAGPGERSKNAGETDLAQ